MNVLAIETTGPCGGVAALQNNQLVLAIDLLKPQTTVEFLAPTIKSVLKQVNWRPTEVELVAVAIGPGSFTGLRIGVTTAKTFAYAAEAEIIGVNTLQVIAARAPEAATDLSAVMDAQRNQVYCGRLRRQSGEPWEWVEETAILDADAWLDQLQPGQAVTGPGLGKLES
ncbi:MAG: tRNA (adenosine(37)-N6)-threonylcarbamoyltransferase complex dimerization subunit type 1 TsaB, partial [Planctomycetales bacterium]